MSFKRTPEELIYDIDECRGPCGKLCMSCPESTCLVEIRDIVQDLINERNEYKARLQRMQSIVMGWDDLK